MGSNAKGGSHSLCYNPKDADVTFGYTGREALRRKSVDWRVVSLYEPA